MARIDHAAAAAAIGMELRPTEADKPAFSAKPFVFFDPPSTKSEVTAFASKGTLVDSLYRSSYDSSLERAGFEPSVPPDAPVEESGFAKWLPAGGNWIRTFGSARDRLRFKALSLVGRLVVRRIEGADQ
jgi:hypothetical protein